MRPENADSAILESVDWTQVDHVLLDMDGTLLDLSFDNDFWGRRIHEKYALVNHISVDEAVRKFEPLFKRVEGTLSWYSTDFWSRQYGYDIIEHSEKYSAGIQWLPYAQEFLNTLRQKGKRTTIVTNAHPDIVKLKHQKTGIKDLVDSTVSSHELGHSKESPRFWKALQERLEFGANSTLFFDDSPAVLKAALQFGINGSISVCQPDSTQPKRSPSTHLAIDNFKELTKSLETVDFS